MAQGNTARVVGGIVVRSVRYTTRGRGALRPGSGALGARLTRNYGFREPVSVCSTVGVDDDTEKPRWKFTPAEYYRRVGRSKTAVHDWATGKRLDPVGDPYLDGEWDRGYVSLRTSEAAALEEIATLVDWLDDIYWAQRRAKAPPPYIKDSGKSQGNENITSDDIETHALEIEGLGPCKLLLRNRSWLHVLDRENRVHRRQASEQLMVELTELGIDEFWPFSTEDLLRGMFPDKIAEPKGDDKK